MMIVNRELARALVEDRLREAETWRRARRARYTRRPTPAVPNELREHGAGS